MNDLNTDLLIHVVPDVGDDEQELEELTAILRDELLELDVLAVDRVEDDQLPDDSKGVAAALGGWLAVNFGPAGLKSVVAALAAWATRTGKTVEVTIDGDVLKLTGTTGDVQARIVEEFFEARKAQH